MSEAISPFRISVIEAVISNETNDSRFESFCRDIVSDIEGGATILPTSASWDLGRDGVGAGIARGVYLSCTLRDDVDAKALADIERICQTTKQIARLYFCFAKPLSEYMLSKIQDQLGQEVEQRFPIHCLGAAQLSDRGARQPHITDRHYSAEIADCTRTIRTDPSDDAESGLRLALMSSAANDSLSIRNQVYSAALLDVLRDGAARTAVTCGKELAAALKLRRSLPAECVVAPLQKLVTAGLVRFESTRYTISAQGLDQIIAYEETAAKRLLSGRQAVRSSLETAVGTTLLDDHFNRIWTIFEEKLSFYLHARGEHVVTEVCSLLNAADGTNDTVPRAASAGFEFVAELADAVGSTSANRQQRTELAQAVKDLFADRTSVATDWLVRLSAAYLAACSLGLEHRSGIALSKVLARTTLVLDSDVALSLLCAGEPEHAAVVTTVLRWKENRGKVLIGEPVLEEIAYHAWIAQHDFDQVSRLIPGTPEDRLQAIGNAFVRGFAELVADGKAKLHQWRAYISQFLGTSDKDSTRVLGELSASYSIEKLPQRSLKEAELEQAVRAHLINTYETVAGPASHKARDKARRDAELYSALVHHVRSLKSVDPGATCLLVSSAKRLANAEARFHESGEPQLVVSIATVLHLVSLLPDVSLGLTAMKAFLFDERRHAFSDELERTLIRMVRLSSEVQMPFAKRASLMREVRERLVKDAESQGIRHVDDRKLAELERQALTPSYQTRFIEVLKDSLDAVAVDTRGERENAELRKKVSELEAEVAKLRRGKKSMHAARGAKNGNGN